MCFQSLNIALIKESWERLESAKRRELNRAASVVAM